LPITHNVDAGRGGFDVHTDLLSAVEICVPAPATDCDEYDWLEYSEPTSPIAVMCQQSEPDPAMLEIPPLPPAPVCRDYTANGRGCATSTSGAGGGWFLGFAVFFATRRRRR
jgi:MYXO-CTERM domain-containing protein